MAETETVILDPRGEVTGADTSIAPRVDSLEGATVGLLDNSKKNADNLLDEIGALLMDQYGAETTIYRMKDKSPIPADDIATELHEKCDVIVNAYGDCGSCTSWCVFDSVDLEGKGTPVATIASDEFAKLAQSEAESHGMPGLPIVTVPHPVADVTEETVRGYADEALDEVVTVLTGSSDDLEAEYTNRYLAADEELGDEALACPIDI